MAVATQVCLLLLVLVNLQIVSSKPLFFFNLFDRLCECDDDDTTTSTSTTTSMEDLIDTMYDILCDCEPRRTTTTARPPFMMPLFPNGTMPNPNQQDQWVYAPLSSWLSWVGSTPSSSATTTAASAPTAASGTTTAAPGGTTTGAATTEAPTTAAAK